MTIAGKPVEGDLVQRGCCACSAPRRLGGAPDRLGLRVASPLRAAAPRPRTADQQQRQEGQDPARWCRCLRFLPACASSPPSSGRPTPLTGKEMMEKSAEARRAGPNSQISCGVEPVCPAVARRPFDRPAGWPRPRARSAPRSAPARDECPAARHAREVRRRASRASRLRPWPARRAPACARGRRARRARTPRRSWGAKRRTTTAGARCSTKSVHQLGPTGWSHW